MFGLKKNTEESCFITLKSDAKFEEKWTYSLENDTEEFSKFLPEHSKILKLGLLSKKNCRSIKFAEDFILESKMVKLSQSKKSKQLDRQDAVRKFYFTFEINEQHN